MLVYRWTEHEDYIDYCVRGKQYEIREIEEWIVENFGRWLAIRYTPDWRWDFTRFDGQNIIFIFQRQEDAILFQLRWA